MTIVSNEDGTVTIPVAEYTRLLNKSSFLNALHDAGVDNWDGYSEALEKTGDIF